MAVSKSGQKQVSPKKRKHYKLAEGKSNSKSKESLIRDSKLYDEGGA